MKDSLFARVERRGATTLNGCRVSSASPEQVGEVQVIVNTGEAVVDSLAYESSGVLGADFGAPNVSGFAAAFFNLGSGVGF